MSDLIQRLDALIKRRYEMNFGEDTSNTQLLLIESKQELASAHEEVKVLREALAKYNELIYAVGKKYPGESRHETALRYIRYYETPKITDAGCAAIAKEKAK